MKRKALPTRSWSCRKQNTLAAVFIAAVAACSAQSYTIECSHKVNIHNVCKSSHFRRAVCFPPLSVLLSSFPTPSSLCLCARHCFSAAVLPWHLCKSVLVSCFLFCAAGWSSREVLPSWSAQGTLWPEDHGQVSVSEVRSIWSTATVQLHALLIIFIISALMHSVFDIVYLVCFQVWNRNWANIWNTRPLWHQGKEKGFVSPCSIWLVPIWNNESSFNEFYSVKPLTYCWAHTSLI